MSELEEIASRYKRRNALSYQSKVEILFNKLIQTEREKVYEQEILKHFKQTKSLKILEVGAGGGHNITFFKRIGILPQHIYANELLEERLIQLRVNHPDVNSIAGDTCTIEENIKFDIVFQSTVFTSLLDETFKLRLADKMKSLLAVNGIILWYDFVYNNPRNKDLKGVSKKKILNLFASCTKIKFTPVTLAPPIGRRIGRLYGIISNLFPFLRTHVVVVIKP